MCIGVLFLYMFLQTNIRSQRLRSFSVCTLLKDQSVHKFSGKVTKITITYNGLSGAVVGLLTCFLDLQQ